MSARNPGCAARERRGFEGSWGCGESLECWDPSLEEGDVGWRLGTEVVEGVREELLLHCSHD